MVGVIEESQDNAQIPRRHEAHRRFRLLRIGNAEEAQTPRQRTSKYCKWSPPYMRVKQWKKYKNL